MKKKLSEMSVGESALGDPIEVNIRGYELTLRNSEAETVIMEVL